MSAQPILPKLWSRDELKSARDTAEQRAARERLGEGPDAFAQMRTFVEAEIRDAMLATLDLTAIDEATLSKHPSLWQILRYFCGPPISEEDLWTLVGRKFKRTPPSAAAAVASTLVALLDRTRFPWVDAERPPTDSERELAIAGTAVLLAHERLKTNKRRATSTAQEDTVCSALTNAGWTFDAARTQIIDLDKLARGSFSRERKVDGVKCDVPVRLRDGRLLALECKVSNGPKNSWKRLAREIGGKAQQWTRQYGSRVVTGAVLSGVYDLSNLVAAQEEQRVYLFWEHDLRSLLEFVDCAS